jgi:hypothetical protein
LSYDVLRLEKAEIRGGPIDFVEEKILGAKKMLGKRFSKQKCLENNLGDQAIGGLK